MDIAGILLVGVLAVTAALVIAAAIVALAPYIAAGVVVVVVLWWVFRREYQDDVPGEPRALEPQHDPPRRLTHRPITRAPRE